MTASIDVPDAGPLFDGHFPGRPILPGVALLAMAVEALGGGPVRAIPHLRLRRPVGPGDRLVLVASADGGTTRVAIERDGAIVANGTISFGAPLAAGRAPTGPAARPVPAAPPLDELLPHRAPMRFVTRIVGEGGDGLTCETRIPAACGLVRDGTAPAFATVEGAAQTAAVWEALRRARAGDPSGPRVGYLVALAGIELHADRVPAEAPMLATVALEDWTPPLAHYRVAVSVDAVPLLRGTIGTWA